MNFSRPPPPTGSSPFPQQSQQASTDWIRPPPSQPPIPTTSSPSSAGAPPSYAFVARVYRRPLRPLVMGFAFFAAMWSFIWGGGALYDIKGSGDFKNINIVLGVLYLVIGLIEVIGFVAAAKQHLAGVRIYAFLSILAALLVVAAEATRFATYFTHKKELIDTCTQASTGLTVETFGSFWGSRGTTETLSQADAQNYCNNSWNRSVWASIAWLILATIVGWFLVSLAFSYQHQLLSPQPIRGQAPSQAYAMGAYNPQVGYQYPAPPGPPPQRQDDFVPPYDPAKLPEYGGGYAGHVSDQKLGGESSEDVAAAGGYSAAAARNV